MKSLIVTDKQLEVIKESCELYGRIQIGQFVQFAEIVTQTGFSGWTLRVQPQKNEGETDEQYKARCDAQEKKDRIICDCIDGVLDGLYRHAYSYEPKPRTNEANIAIDLGILDVNEVVETLKNKPEEMEIVLTGRNAKQEIIEIAHLVSNIDPIKHYWDTGVAAREGIEY